MTRPDPLCLPHATAITMAAISAKPARLAHLSNRRMKLCYPHRNVSPAIKPGRPIRHRPFSLPSPRTTWWVIHGLVDMAVVGRVS
jgi:hypothetical protein